jgi:hypothetical protein
MNGCEQTAMRQHNRYQALPLSVIMGLIHTEFGSFVEQWFGQFLTILRTVLSVPVFIESDFLSANASDLIISITDLF